MNLPSYHYGTQHRTKLFYGETNGYMTLMYDSTNVDDIPTDAQVVAYYIDGRYATTEAYVRARFPNAYLIKITTFANLNADVIDVENGDATPEVCYNWTLNKRVEGFGWPTAYASDDTWEQIKAIFNQHGAALPLWWEANPNGQPTLLPGRVAHQFKWPDTPPGNGTGAHYDLSVISEAWPPGRNPLGKELSYMPAVVLPNGKVAIYAVGAGDRAGQLLEFTRDAGDNTGASNSVIDITDQIGTSDPYTVSQV